MLLCQRTVPPRLRKYLAVDGVAEQVARRRLQQRAGALLQQFGVRHKPVHQVVRREAGHRAAAC
jgi:hypothetical protein